MATDPRSLVLTIGNPQLREPSAPVSAAEFGSDALHALIEQMTAAMRASHGIGIAAPQIGILKRVLLMEVDSNPRYPDAPRLPLLCLINPVLAPLSDAREEAFEGCLSIPGMRGPVWRDARVAVEAMDPDGQPQRLEFTGPFARVLQHEVDHLDGILYFDRIRPEDLPRFGTHQSLLDAGVDLSLTRATPATWRRLEGSREKDC